MTTPLNIVEPRTPNAIGEGCRYCTLLAMSADFEDHFAADYRRDANKIIGALKEPHTVVHRNVRERPWEEVDILYVGESPGCISGDSLIETAFRDKSEYPQGIPIRELVGKKGFYVYSFDVTSQKLVLGRVKRVWKTGKKQVYRVTYTWTYNRPGPPCEVITFQDSLVVTDNHPFLLKRRLTGKRECVDYFSILQGLSVGHSLQPFYRRTEDGYGRIGISTKEMLREGRYLLGQKTGSPLGDGEQCHHDDENKLNDTSENLVRTTTPEHARIHMLRGNPLASTRARANHAKVMHSLAHRQKLSSRMKEVLADPKVYAARLKQINGCKHKIQATVKKNYEDPQMYFNYLTGRRDFKGRPRNPRVTEAAEYHAKNGGAIFSVAKKFGVTYTSLYQRINNRKSKSLETPEQWVARKFSQKFPGVPLPFSDNHKVVSIEPCGVQDVYDMEVEKYHNFATHGIFVHNSVENVKGLPFIGPSGKKIRKVLGELFDLTSIRIAFSNVLGCRPPLDRNPTKTEVKACSPELEREVLARKPKVIVPLGNYSLEFFTGRRGILAVFGHLMPCSRPGMEHIKIVPCVHPAYVLRANHVEPQFREALLLGGKVLLGDYEARQGEGEYYTIDDADTAVELLAALRADRRLTAFDTETGSDHPWQTKFPNLLCLSFSNEEGIGYTIPYDHPDSPWSIWPPDLNQVPLEMVPERPRKGTKKYAAWKEANESARGAELAQRTAAFDKSLPKRKADRAKVKAALVGFFTDPTFNKLAQNGKFDTRFILYELGCEVVGTVYDTMLTHLTLEDQRNTHGLEVLAYQFTGMGGYHRALDEWVKDHDEANPRLGGSYARIPG